MSMHYTIKAVNTQTDEIQVLRFDVRGLAEASEAIRNIEFDEDDNPYEWIFTIEPQGEDEYEEPADIDDDFGFDPYEGCYTYDC